YMMTEKNSNWEYKIETTDPAVIAYDQTTSTTPYTIKSYRQAPGGIEQQPVKWKVVSYQESADGGLTWGTETQTKPTWLTNLTTESGDGGTAAESGSVTLTTDIVDFLAKRNNALKTATPLGAAGAPYDLSTKGGSAARNTANSYVISAPGHYRIPLVYGNAIKNNATNTSSYQTSNSGTYILQHFKDHAGQDITDPWITQSNGGANAPDAAKIVWADESGLVTNLSVTGSGTNAFVKFEVPANKIKNGNAVIAVTKGGTVVWSWHLWFAPQDALGTVACTNFQNKVYNFTNETLGWKYTVWNGTTYSAPRKVKVKVRQMAKNGTNYEEGVITITQNNGNVRQGYATLYQFGRKDAFPGVDASKLAAGSHFTENAGNNMSIQNGIQNPGSFYTWGSSWYSTPPTGYSYYNLWSADNTVTGGNDNSVVKTVYDPCPVGFKMPASNAFTGFTANGQNGGTMNVNGTDNLQTYQNNFGHNFWTSSSKTATINFPASGYRDSYDGSLLGVGSYGYYWSVVPYNSYGGCHLYFGSGYVYPLYYDNRSYGLAARPVSE
ncbi:MAG: fimbrillin family protein, partial [Hoylesella enoeca]